MNDSRQPLFVGVDWATQEHQVCVLDAEGKVLEEDRVANSGEGLARFCDALMKLSGGDPHLVQVAIEVPHGAVVETLLEREFLVHSINPKQLDRFRDRFTVAGAKDDRLDARVLADSLRTDAARYRRLSLLDPEIIQLRECSRTAEELQGERCRLTNQLREVVRRYFPQALNLKVELSSEWFLDLLELMPTPHDARRIRRARVAKVLRERRVRKYDAEEVLCVLREKPVHVAPGTEEAAVRHVRLLIKRLRLVNAQLRETNQQIDVLLAKLAGPAPEDEPGQEREQRDVEILRTLPGIGRVVLATLLAEATEPLRRRDYQALRAVTGLAPVTRQSGKRKVVSMRRACNPRLQTALYHWARVAAQREPLAKAHYAELRRRGHGHGRALRGVGDRLLNLMCSMLRHQAPYDPARRAA